MWLGRHVVKQGVRGMGWRTKNFPWRFYKDFESYSTAITNVHLKRSGIVDITMLYSSRHVDTH